MKKPFFEHLKELNIRIFFSFSLIVVLSIFIYAKYPFFIEVLNEPLINAGYDKSNIFALTIYEGFQVKITNVFLISLIIKPFSSKTILSDTSVTSCKSWLETRTVTSFCCDRFLIIFFNLI